MKRLRLYFDCSSVSALEEPSKPERMKVMRTLWEMIKKGDYEVVFSGVLLEELMRINDIEKRDIILYRLTEIEAELIEISEEARKIARKVIKNGILTENHYDDCTHIGCAMTSRCDTIVSYNFNHMVNVRVIKGVRSISFLEGYGDIDIVTPEALIKGEET